MMAAMRTLDELTATDDPAWPLLTAAIAESPVAATALRPAEDPSGAETCLRQLQVTTRSHLGAMALHSGGLLIDGGWLRVYGGAGTGLPDGLPSLGAVNGVPAAPDPGWVPEAALVLAHDVLGGTFALNGGDPAAAGRPGSPGEMTYFAPDTLAWEALGAGHGAWLTWLLSADDTGGSVLDGFYASLRWPSWRTDVAALALSEGFSCVPFLWTAEARRHPGRVRRKAVPFLELLSLSAEFAAATTGSAPGFLGRL